MDGKELLSPSDLFSPYYGQLAGGHSGMQLPGLHGPHSVIRPMPNMSPTAILQSIGGGSLAGVQFPMDSTPPPMPRPSVGSVGAAPGSGQGPAEPVKRKRGRPRKYGPDGTMKMPTQQQPVSPPPRMGSLSAVLAPGSGAEKKRRGRPPGTGKKQQLATPGNLFSGSAGTSFTPHIITASPSEDVAAKIVAFANQASRAVCILSAIGSISRVTLRQSVDVSSISRIHSATAQATYKNVPHEGLFEILSLSGSFNMEEGSQDQCGRLVVTLCGHDRQVIGGVVNGALVAASMVQVVLGSFLHVGSRSKSKKSGKQPVFGSDSLTGGLDTSPPSSGHNQNLTPPSVTGGGWPSSTIFETRSSSIDINSSRG